ncbi:MAG: GtrA family protein [Candidatus Paceibacterota bacterium]|jgi:putative flippase GtrA
MTLLPTIKKFLEMRPARSMATGAAAVVVQTIVFEILGIYLHLFSPSTAVVISAETAILTNFYLSNRFAFNDRQHNISIVSRILRFHLVVSGSVFLQWLFIFIIEHQTSNHLFINAAYAAGVILGFAWNYTFYLFFVWRQPKPQDLST